MIVDLIKYFQYPFVMYALIASVLVAASSSLLGATLTLKRYAFISDSLSHVAFFGMAVSTASHTIGGTALSLPVTIVVAILILCGGERFKLRGDAALAMVSVGSLAIGYLVFNLTSTSANLAGDVCATLFGSTSILTLTEADVWLFGGLAVLVIVLFIWFNRYIFAVTFDESFATAVGGRVTLYNVIYAVIVAIVIVLAMNLVGSLLMAALVIFPAMAAMRLYKSFREVLICSLIFSVTLAVVGLIASILLGTPVGSSIVAADIAGFCLFSVVRRIKIALNSGLTA